MRESCYNYPDQAHLYLHKPTQTKTQQGKNRNAKRRILKILPSHPLPIHHIWLTVQQIPVGLVPLLEKKNRDRKAKIQNLRRTYNERHIPTLIPRPLCPP